MIVVNADLDNTIIYSYKHDIGADKIGVEEYHERTISYITPKTYRLLSELKAKSLLVPTSTRTIEQYKRIDLQTGGFKYALVCNGGQLLVDGEPDREWYEESLGLIEESIIDLKKGMEILERDSRRYFELRFIDELFVFTKCHEPEAVVCELASVLDAKMVDVFNNGDKVYIVPAKLSKGRAIERFRNYISYEADTTPKKDIAEGHVLVIAAGDSEFDISMLESADIGLAPHGFIDKYLGHPSKIREMEADRLFSEGWLSEALSVISGNEV